MLLSHPDDIGHVLVSHARDYVRETCTIKSRDERTWVPSRGGLVSNPDHDEHLRARRVLQPAFRQARMDASFEHFVAVVDRTIDRWTDVQELDVLPELGRLALEMSIDVTFGRRLAISTAALMKRLEMFMAITDPITSPAREAVSRLRLVRLARTAAAYDGLLEQVEELFEEVRARGASEETAVAALLRQEGVAGLDARTLAFEAIGLFFADYDSTASAGTWSLYLLARHPAALRAVRAEGRAGRGRRYVDAVIREALRLYPPSWAIRRVARRDQILGGTPIRAGTTVWICPYLLHRDARWFTDPDRFRPERWLTRRVHEPHAYIPFSAGPHKCLGYGLALRELCAIVSTTARRCDLASLASEPLGVAARSSVHPKTPLRIRATKIR